MPWVRPDHPPPPPIPKSSGAPRLDPAPVLLLRPAATVRPQTLADIPAAAAAVAGWDKGGADPSEDVDRRVARFRVMVRQRLRLPC